MPKTPTFPPLYDSALQIHISKLKEWGYFKPNQITKSTYTWSEKGYKLGSISIEVNFNTENPYIILDYTHNDKPRRYIVSLESIPSNLGIGEIWYFLCPQTGKRCRKLYLIDGYFFHRDAFRGCMYASQTQSKYSRYLDQTLGTSFRLDRLYAKLYSKHFKKLYAGKPTKSYLKIMKLIQQTEERVEIMSGFAY